MPRTQSVKPVEASRRRPGKHVESRKARAALPHPQSRKNTKKTDYVVVPVPLTGGRVRGAPQMSKDNMERVRSRVRGAGKRTGNVILVNKVEEAHQGAANHIDVVTPGSRHGMPTPKPDGKPKSITVKGGSIKDQKNTNPEVIKYLNKKRSKMAPRRKMQSKRHPTLFKGEGNCGKCNECAH